MTHYRKRYVNTRFWNTKQEADFFPELHDSDFSLPYVKKRKDLGVCFSGGGTRSASATLGQLRGLKQIGLLGKIGYISAVSGGSWGSAPFIFLPNEFDEDTLLGPYIPPEKLSLAELKSNPDKSMAKVISETVISDDFLKEVFSLSGDESFSRAIGRLFLEPFGLHHNNKSIAYDGKTVKAIIKNNSIENDRNYYLKNDDFILTRKNRPFFIVNGTLLRQGNDDKRLKKMLCEYTPIYTGVRTYFPEAGRRKYLLGGKRPIGGGYIQTFAYDAATADRETSDGLITVKCGRNCFTLSDIIGSSGAAPEEAIRKYGFTFLGFPEFNHFPIPQVNNGKLFDEEEYAHGDGGHLENFGLMPLLARQVKKIIVFINTPTPFEANKTLRDKHGYPDRDFTDDLGPLFGRNDKPEGFKKEYDPVKLAVNQVFEGKKLDELLDAFRNCKRNGKPLVHYGHYNVMNNNHYGISTYEARIYWVYLDNAKNWLNKLTDHELKTNLAKKKNGFERFPHYKTFLENPPNIIDLGIDQVNLLAHLTSWIVTSSKDDIYSKLDI